MSKSTRACISTVSSFRHTKYEGPLSDTGSITENAMRLFLSHFEHAALRVVKIAFLHTQWCTGLFIS